MLSDRLQQLLAEARKDVILTDQHAALTIGPGAYAQPHVVTVAQDAGSTPTPTPASIMRHADSNPKTWIRTGNGLPYSSAFLFR